MTGAPKAPKPVWVVVPAHNEASVITRLLAGLTDRSIDDGVEVVVVCNGCTDETAAIARRFGSAVHVVEIDEASKHAALRAGNEVARGFPRVYVDADIEIGASSIGALARAVSSSDTLAAGPERKLDRRGASLLVRFYYDVWERLPSVRCGLFGRGVIAVSEEGFRRIEGLPAVMGDDLVISESFSVSERRIVPEAVAVVRVPRTVADLYRRRVRAATGNVQADGANLRPPDTKTGVRTVARLLMQEPRLLPKAPFFIALTLAGRIGALKAVRRGDFATWRRDESSRQ